MGFSKDFIWGAASSSYQIEGAWSADGKGRNIWDDFTHVKGNIANDETGDISCDSYNKYPEDIEVISQMGLDAYRFSIAWARIFPLGSGEVNEKGLAYYDKLVDALLEKGIEPFVTLFHWDLPSALQEKGGWANRETAEAFSVYAKLIAKHFEGRVKNYFTLNEPQCTIGHGLINGIHAPGYKVEQSEALLCMHNILLAHGLAVSAMRAAVKDINIGIASTGRLCYPSSLTKENIESARASSFLVDDNTWYFSHTWVVDPIVLGRYPESESKTINEFILGVSKEDLEIISAPIDILGVNVYNGQEIDANGNRVKPPKGAPVTALKWPVTPKVMHMGLIYLQERYNLPVYITENGLSCNDKVYLDNSIHDNDRIDFLNRYLNELEKACQENPNFKGYFHWSLCDNFEWHSGYDERFGLIFMDYNTLERIPKDSALWYKEYISSKR